MKYVIIFIVIIVLSSIIGCVSKKRPLLTMHISQGFSVDNGVFFITSYKYALSGRQFRLILPIKTSEKVIEMGTRLYYYDTTTGMLNYITPVSPDYLTSDAVQDVKWIRKAKGYYVDIPKNKTGNQQLIRILYDYDAKEHVLNVLEGDELTKARMAFDNYRFPYSDNPGIVNIVAMDELLKNVPFEQWQLPGEKTELLQY